jgi:hypothetical protein
MAVKIQPECPRVVEVLAWVWVISRMIKIKKKKTKLHFILPSSKFFETKTKLKLRSDLGILKFKSAIQTE